ncbi:MAG: TonB-dependent receptor plug domain-containing protein, partial [Bacteroidota bacterium]
MSYSTRYNTFIFFICLMTSLPARGQESLGSASVFESKVDDLMRLAPQPGPGVQIESASKQSERIFEAPVAATVITRKEIQNAGCMSIMEALRLLPGVIVRETSNGNYDINIRGFNNSPPASDFFSMDNTNSLVMIDYRPIFNYFSGGVFWESLPIDVTDVERIELVRGPVAALYGSNAVTGVIHIITRKLKREGLNTYGHFEVGNQNTLRLTTAAGYSWGPKLQFHVSGNVTQRDRFTREMYDIFGQGYTSRPDTIRSWQTNELINFRESYPFPQKGIARYGVNG